MKLASDDVLALGGAARLCYHGIDGMIAGSSRLLEGGGRINLPLAPGDKASCRARAIGYNQPDRVPVAQQDRAPVS